MFNQLLMRKMTNKSIPAVTINNCIIFCGSILKISIMLLFNLGTSWFIKFECIKVYGVLLASYNNICFMFGVIPNGILYLTYSLPCFTLAITYSNCRAWKHHFKWLLSASVLEKRVVTTHYLKTLINSALITCYVGENVTPELDGLSWAKPLLDISVLWSLGQFFYEYCFFHAISLGKFQSHLFGMFSDITCWKLYVYHLSQMQSNCNGFPITNYIYLFSHSSAFIYIYISTFIYCHRNILKIYCHK